MFRAAVLMTTAMAAAGLAGCSKNRPVSQMPLPALEQAVLARGVAGADEDFRPMESGESFPASVPEVVAWVRIKNISKVCSLRWMWYSPDASLYYDSGDTIVQPSGTYHPYVTSWQALPVATWQAAELPGNWRVVIQMNGTELTTLGFKLEPPPEQMIGGTRKGA